MELVRQRNHHERWGAKDVLQVPHHGSAHSEPDEFANWTRPKWALIAGANTDGLISTPIYEKHGAAVLNTAQCGAITATINSAGLSVDCFLPTAQLLSRDEIAIF